MRLFLSLLASRRSHLPCSCLHKRCHAFSSLAGAQQSEPSSANTSFAAPATEKPLETACLQGLPARRNAPVMAARFSGSSGPAPTDTPTANASSSGHGANNQQQDDGPAQRSQEGPEPAVNINANQPQ